MRTTLIIIVTMLFGYFLFFNHKPKSNNRKNLREQTLWPLATKRKKILQLVFYQDVSTSITSNGVELISPSIFNPLFTDFERSIEINFGCISRASAGKLISIELPEATFQRPDIPDLHGASITEKRKLKGDYLHDLNQYQSDSTRFFGERNKRIVEFCRRVDSLVGIYRKKLSGGTDIITAIETADKVFNLSDSGSQSYLILNSDGHDSFGHSAKIMKNKSTVILVNAGPNSLTSVDKILSKTLESPEQAIQFILNH